MDDGKWEELADIKDRLISIGKPAVPELIELLKEPETLSACGAVEVLGEIGDERAIGPLADVLEEKDIGDLAGEALVKMGPACLPEVIRRVEERVADPVKEEDRIRQVTDSALSTIAGIRTDTSVEFLIDLLYDYISMMPPEEFDVEQHEWKYQNVDFFHLLDCMVRQQDRRAIPAIRAAQKAFPEEYVDHKMCRLAIERIETGKVEGYIPLEAVEHAFPTEVIMNAFRTVLDGLKESSEEYPGPIPWDEREMEWIERRFRPTEGTCQLCGGMFTKQGMLRHLSSCRWGGGSLKPAGSLKKETAIVVGKMETSGVFHIVVEGEDLPDYWMHLEVPADSTLETLDHFLRETWLECCGHPSSFRIEGISYASGHATDPMLDHEIRNLSTRLDAILRPGMKFHHEYDYGSTTQLSLRVVSERAEGKWRGGIRLLARNEPPDIPCESCGRPAARVCTGCIDWGEAWFCDDCASWHECDSEMFLPVVNSPRVGVCGYTG